MSQRRVFIGAMIGILSFTILSWIGNSTWQNFEAQILGARSGMRIYNPFDKTDYMMIKFDAENKFNFENQSSQTKKETLLNLITDLSKKGSSSITVVTDRNNSLNLDDIDLELALGKTETTARTIRLKDIETRWFEAGGKEQWLDRKSHRISKATVADLMQEVIVSDQLVGRDIILISPNVILDRNESNLIINYIEDRWVNFAKIPSFVSFVLLALMGVVLSALVYWARIVAFFLSGIAALILGQIIFSFSNTHIETMPFLLGSFLILMAANLFDLNIEGANKKRIFRDQTTEGANPEDVNMAQPFISQEGPSATVITQEIRNKFFAEQENSFEDIALEFQEKTVKDITDINEKLNELQESNDLSERDATKLTIIKHNFDHMVEEFDAILFNLVPFQFEGDSGLINLLELYASKLFILSKGKIKIDLETQFPILKLEGEQKANTYRTIQKIIDLIRKENYHRVAAEGLMINIGIQEIDNGGLRFLIAYEGRSVKQKANNFRLREIERRVAAIHSAEIELPEPVLAEITDQLSNHIDLKIYQPQGSLIKASPATV